MYPANQAVATAMASCPNPVQTGSGVRDDREPLRGERRAEPRQVAQSDEAGVMEDLSETVPMA